MLPEERTKSVIGERKKPAAYFRGTVPAIYGQCEQAGDFAGCTLNGLAGLPYEMLLSIPPKAAIHLTL